MGWSEQLQEGKFRKAAFKINSADGEFGRRIALHEYPGRDKPFAEDLGRKARQFTLDLIVVGKNYMAERDALIAALEYPGPGTLIHPWRGPLTVVVVSARGPRESTRQGGMASFTVTFVEAGEALQPTSSAATVDAIKEQTGKARTQLQDDFAGQFSVAGPEYLAGEAGKLLQAGADRLKELSRQIAAPGQLAADFVDDVGAFSLELTSLLRAPAELAMRVIGMGQDLGRLAENPLQAIETCKQLWNWGDDTPAVQTTTGTRQQQAANRTAITNLIQRAALVDAIEQSADHAYQSTDQSVALRESLTDQIDLTAETAGDALYAVLTQLRLVLIRDVAARGLVLPRIVRYTPAMTLPAIVLAYRLHGDPEREADLVTRNRVQHPGFVPGGQTLEILGDG